MTERFRHHSLSCYTLPHIITDYTYIYYRITYRLFTLHNELKWLHLHKQYQRTAPLIVGITHTHTHTHAHTQLL